MVCALKVHLTPLPYERAKLEYSGMPDKFNFPITFYNKNWKGHEVRLKHQKLKEGR